MSISTAVASLMPLDNWIRLFRLTPETITKHLHRGIILGVPVERRWAETVKLAPEWIMDVHSREAVETTTGHAFEITHPHFRVKVDATDLQEIFRVRHHMENPQVPVMVEGDFDAYDSFQVLLKMIGDDT